MAARSSDIRAVHLHATSADHYRRWRAPRLRQMPSDESIAKYYLCNSINRFEESIDPAYHGACSIPRPLSSHEETQCLSSTPRSSRSRPMRTTTAISSKSPKPA
ncbi:hypothetical protein XFF6166_690009 [Xanthomonas citri pv. fuscans]|nr:hypothetical protein XFF6166_690009 [Xanthomonas citri pv. fuscans]SOO02421.1 hypothetical protein XFF6960_600027 [Xanthomonas citri pv. fuscans]SOO05073.1 hypothetical protein XFF7767_350026 [Xanthomonas citri pv. fuscans]SOO44811.1 hypothetical protein XFF1815_660009 [Xanthomonas citri pv. fuscans]